MNAVSEQLQFTGDGVKRCFIVGTKGEDCFRTLRNLCVAGILNDVARYLCVLCSCLQGFEMVFIGHLQTNFLLARCQPGFNVGRVGRPCLEERFDGSMPHLRSKFPFPHLEGLIDDAYQLDAG